MFFEVPDVGRVLREQAFWDIYYEHCSYFSPGSLARVFRANRFDVIELAKEYDEQYVMIVVRPVDRPTSARLRTTARKARSRFSSLTASSINCSCIAFSRDSRLLPPAAAGSDSPRLQRFCPALLPSSPPWRAGALRLGSPGDLSASFQSRSLRFAAWLFGPSLGGRCSASSLLRPLLTSPLRLRWRRSPRVRRCIFLLVPSDSTSCVSCRYRASLWPASSPPARGLSVGSCSYGRGFASGFLQLGLAASALPSATVAPTGPDEYLPTH